MRCNSPKDDLSFEYVQSLLEYDSGTGLLRWKVSKRANGIGTIAGYVARDGYIRVKIDQSLYAAHRLIWLLTYGEWPSLQIDHINRVKTDNRVGNLRIATPSENSRNRNKPRPYRRPNARGCTFIKRLGKWQVQISIHGTENKKYLGLFTNETDAMAAYQRALSEDLR